MNLPSRIDLANQTESIKTVKVIITGGREYSDYNSFCETLNYLFKGLSVHLIAGACSDSKKGVLTFTRPDGTKVYGCDGLTERYAAQFDCEFTPYPANWNKHGKAAGPIRNTEMSKTDAEVCIGFWDGKSKGTFDMMTKADKAGMKVIEKRYNL